jgi:hypothetical protein
MLLTIHGSLGILHQMVNELFGSCHVVAWDLDAPTFPNSFMDAPCGPKAPLYWPISKFLRWTDPLPPEERISVSANKHFVGKSICFILHTSAYFCCVVTKSKKNGHRHAVDCEFPSNVQALGFVQKLDFHLKVFEEPDTLCCDQCSHKFLSSSAKCRDEMHQRPSSNGHSQNENTNRKSLRLSIFPG